MSSLIGMILLGLTVVYIGRNLFTLWVDFNRSIASIGNYPGLRLLLYPHSLFGMLPRLPYINIGDQHAIRYGHSLFSSRGKSDVLSIVSFFPPFRSFIIADPVSIKHVVMDRAKYIKPPHMYRALQQFGMNLAVAEGDVWRRHRKIVAGSFTEKTNELAWDETGVTMEKLFEEWNLSKRRSADGRREVLVDSMVDLTLKITLFVISAAAFSHRPPWSDDEKDPASIGHSISFRVALHGILDGAVTKVMTPKWAYNLPIKRLDHVARCYRECDSYLAAFVAERKASTSDLRESTTTGRKDLLGALCYAAESAEVNGEDEGEDKGNGEKKRSRLSDEEVMGNMYVFLLAGHETTAHTLAFAFALLALHPAIQDELYEDVIAALPEIGEPSYEDYSKLVYSHATFLEALRLYPSVIVIPKFAVVDTVIPTSPLEDGTPAENVFVPKWTEILLDTVALHRNPKYWGKDCDDFRPKRFIDVEETGYKWPRDAFLGFSAGHRSRPGRGFGTVEAVAVLSLIMRKYSVHLAEDLDGSAGKRRVAGESFEEKVKRVMQCRSVITLTPGKTALVFRER